MEAYMNSTEKREQVERRGRLNNILDDPNLSPEEKLKVKECFDLVAPYFDRLFSCLFRLG